MLATAMESLLLWWWKDTLFVHTAAATADTDACNSDGVHAATVMERHPARPYCCSHSRHRCLQQRCSPFCYGDGKTPCTSILLQPQQTQMLATAMESLLLWWWKDTLHVNTVIVEKTLCTSARPYFQLRKDFLHIPTAGGENTLCTSILHYARQYCC